MPCQLVRVLLCGSCSLFFQCATLTPICGEWSDCFVQVCDCACLATAVSRSFLVFHRGNLFSCSRTRTSCSAPRDEHHRVAGAAGGQPGQRRGRQYHLLLTEAIDTAQGHNVVDILLFLKRKRDTSFRTCAVTRMSPRLCGL